MASITALVSSTAPPVSPTASTTSPVPFTAGTIASGGWRPRRASPPWCRPLHLRCRSWQAPPFRCRSRRAPPPPVAGVHGEHHRSGVVHCTSGVVHCGHHLSGAVHGGHHRLRWLASTAGITALVSSTAPPVPFTAGTTAPMPFTAGTTASGDWRPRRASPPWCRPLHLRCRPWQAPPLRCRSRRAPSPPVAGVHGEHHRPAVVHCTSGVVHGGTTSPVLTTAGTTAPMPFTAGTTASGDWCPRRASPPCCRPLHLRCRPWRHHISGADHGTHHRSGAIQGGQRGMKNAVKWS
ncbi:hypothetical protein V3C99_003580 [Haemonchus contortus]